ncbi:MAG TPA: endopeptidase La, partial [Candidatus Hydrogenedentes bacterium]|nr:endopeptidase La [Candidatus Hydrogenedentota bacterium]
MSETHEQESHLPARGPQEFPDVFPVMGLPQQVVFPMSLAPLQVTEHEEKLLIEDVARGNRFVGLVLLRDPDASEPGPENMHEVGCLGRLFQMQRDGDGINVVIQALKRFRIVGIVQRKPYCVVRAEVLEDVGHPAEAIAPLATTVKMQMGRLITLSPNIPDGARHVIENIDDPGFLADLAAGNLGIAVEEKQKLLASADPKERLQRLTYLLARETELLEASNKIHAQVKGAIDKGQREFYLRQQMKAIQEELGEGEDQRPEIQAYREKVEALGAPDDVRKEALRELDRLTRMHESSAEYHVVTTYLDTIIELPWNRFTEGKVDIDRADRILNQDHYGLNKVKERILEYLAVRKLKPDAAGPILCFVGPPGVGKTSLGKSIARALNRAFTRMSLGGVRDEAEIRGHRKTYVGALPGRIIQNIRKAGSANPVFMLDEIDKLGADFRGDPSSALLEVLDPAQNDTFVDHYLNVPFDLSRVMFIATANVTDTIPWALRDRMEVIEIPGYTLDEKIAIAERYLVPRQREAHGLSAKQLTFQKSALRRIIGGYTREAGVRNLEREIAHVCRGCARRFAGRRRKPIRIGPAEACEFLGPERVFYNTAEHTRIPGVAIGLAWTPTGGDILFIEATHMPGKGQLLLTGQLGDVMKESARAALSYLRAHSKALGLEKTDFTELDVHLHVPAGAVPKDGPSAGVALLTAMASLFTGKRVKNALAMTGEITLRGLVLPVGGVKEKVLAAARAKVKTVILPDRNRNDLEDVPEDIRK